MTDIIEGGADSEPHRRGPRRVPGPTAHIDAAGVVTAPPMTQAIIDAVTQLEASKKDTSPGGFQKRLQLAYAVYDQSNAMMQEIESQHARLVSELLAVSRRSPLAGES